MATISEPTTDALTGAWEEVEVNRVCFRGERRAPTRELRNPTQNAFINQGSKGPACEIFNVGFKARKPEKVPVYLTPKPEAEKIGSIDNPTAVCVSTDFFATPFFPLSSAQKDTRRLSDVWSYAVYVEKAYDTKMRLALHGMDIIKYLTEVQQTTMTLDKAAAVNWALFGQELAVKGEIPPINIIAAVKTINRKIVKKQAAFEHGVAFELDKLLVVNKDFRPKSLSKEKAKEIHEKTVSFLRKEINNQSRTVTPNQYDAIVKTVKSGPANIEVEAEATKKSINLHSVRSHTATISQCILPSQTRHIAVIRKDIARIKCEQEMLTTEKAVLQEELDSALNNVNIERTEDEGRSTNRTSTGKNGADELYWV